VDDLWYWIISPQWNFTLTNVRWELQASSEVVFSTNDIKLGEVFEVTMEAYRNDTFYLWITKEFSVTCLKHCKFCSNLDKCDTCLPGYYYKCESITDESQSSLWSSLIIISLLTLFFSQTSSLSVPDEFWILFNAIQLSRISTLQSTHLTPNLRVFLNHGLSIFSLLPSTNYIPDDILSNIKTISHEFSEFNIISEQFLLTFFNAVAIFMGFYVSMSLIYFCCWLSNLNH
jgi:hypothetical protein